MESSESSKNLTRTQKMTILLIVFLTFTSLLLSIFKTPSFPHKKYQKTFTNSTIPPPHPTIKSACATTLYPSLCFTTLSSVPKNPPTFHHILEITINRTIKSVKATQFKVSDLFTHQDLNSQEKNALQDCMEMLDQTLYELREAIDDLHFFPKSRSYGNLKTLLSAAMTNENTCIDGFSDLEAGGGGGGPNLKTQLQDILTPISRMISNCLSMIKHMETKNSPNGHRKITVFPGWMSSGDRSLMERAPKVTAHVVVSGDGGGNCTTIGEAIAMAPNRSLNRFVIKIKRGVYNESVVIGREKFNIMLVGDGMNSTIITGSKNFADGFSTFTSATLTVVGDKFLARDLTIINTAGPEKHQAVAVRVTSNSAFYRCNFTSYQDTLYAHSLRQFYRECRIQGTIDFIFGNAAAVFQNCLIIVRRPNPGQRNMITAQGREDPNQDTGISLQNCRIEAAPDFNTSKRQNFSTFLGRPWRNYSRTVIMRSYLGDLIDPQGWSEWNRYSRLDTVEYIEYLNYGPGSDTRRRVNWGGYRKNCSEDMVKQFTAAAFLRGEDDWLASTGFPMSSGS